MPIQYSNFGFDNKTIHFSIPYIEKYKHIFLPNPFFIWQKEPEFLNLIHCLNTRSCTKTLSKIGNHVVLFRFEKCEQTFNTQPYCLFSPLVHVAVLLQLLCSTDSMRELSTISQAWYNGLNSEHTKGKPVFLWNNGSLIKELICQRECIPLRFSVEILLPYEWVWEQQEKHNVPCHVKTGTRVLQVHKLSLKCIMNGEAPYFVSGWCHSRFSSFIAVLILWNIYQAQYTS